MLASNVPHRTDSRRTRLWLCGLLLVALVLPLVAAGRAQAQAKKADGPAIPPPEPVELETKDGVTMKATFYPGTLGKESVPVILVHGFEGSAKEYATLAPFLQAQGHAVLVPDLRGHGESVKVRGATRDLKASTLPVTQFANMVAVDMEKCKRFLMEKNNAGELNIEKLCVVGSEMGAVVAMNWTLRDWLWPPLATGKQGQDVKALVLLSPEWSSHGLTATDLFRYRQICDSLSVFVVVGSDRSRSVRDAKRIYEKFEQTRPAPEEPRDRDLFYVERDTKLQGTKLLAEKAFGIDKLIAQFIKLRLVDQSYPWTNRTNALQRATN